jgi:hypothetical protein
VAVALSRTEDSSSWSRYLVLVLELRGAIVNRNSGPANASGMTRESRPSMCTCWLNIFGCVLDWVGLHDGRPELDAAARGARELQALWDILCGLRLPALHARICRFVPSSDAKMCRFPGPSNGTNANANQRFSLDSDYARPRGESS